ncbi:MAG: ABC transporter permease [Anaerolineaceae bacterium]|nr:ABC transporter permease [Anaerolineaceae bacterium]MBN2677291.1 ABC transporter permease [Anaerolineaceae bacterium]
MNILFITFKDLGNSLRKPLMLAFMLLLPLLQAGLPYLAFHGLSGGLEVQTTRVVVVNLDQAVAAYPDFLAGNLLSGMLADEELDSMLDVTMLESESAARQMIDADGAGVAVIIPAGLTASLFEQAGHAEVVIYHDPTLTLGPGIVSDVVTNFLDGFAGSLIAADVTSSQLETLGRRVSETTRQDAMLRYGDWAQAVGESLSQGIHPAIRYGGQVAVREADSVMRAIIGPMMAGMLVFGSVLFGIQWGAVFPVFFNGLGLALSAAGFGILLVSFMRTTRQAFLIMGGTVILTGMAGGTMTTTFANLPAAFRTLNLFTPQGWVLRGLTTSLQGGTLAETTLPALIAAAMGLVFLLAGWFNLNRRYS